MIGDLARENELLFAGYVDPLDRLLTDFNAETSRMVGHLCDQIGTRGLRDSRVVDDLARRERATADVPLLENNRFQQRTPGVNARRKARRAGADDHQIEVFVNNGHDLLPTTAPTSTPTHPTANDGCRL